MRKYFAAALVVFLLGAGVYWGYRTATRSAERSEAVRLAEQRRYAEAVPKLRAVLERDPGDAEVLQKLVESLIASGALRVDVLPYLDRWCEVRRDDPRPFLLRMDNLEALGRNDEALADARRVIALRFDQSDAHWTAARLLRDAGRYDEADGECAKLLGTDWPRFEVLALRTQIRLEKGDHGGAAETLAALFAERPGFEPAVLYRGILRQKQGQFRKAADDLAAAAHSEVPQVRQPALYYLGLALTSAGRSEEARAAFDRLAKDQVASRARVDAGQLSDDPGQQARAARALLDAGRPGEAAEFLEAAVSRLGASPTELSLLAECYEKQGRPDLAVQARRRKPDRP
jgi:tetratricopeptide (TPR) repeat protein